MCVTKMKIIDQEMVSEIANIGTFGHFFTLRHSLAFHLYSVKQVIGSNHM